MNVALHPQLQGIALCAGVGMLDEGLRAALQFLGQDYRTVCYVEREAAAAGQLVTLMEAGAIDSAPVWSDLRTFDGAAWSGKVDFISAGFPCQDLSVAGRRAGLDGRRSGLFFEVVRIATDSGAWAIVLENVSGIASAKATVVDEAEGELEERAAARVVGELADLGWSAEWLHLRASDVGANHQRERWFCVAWRMGHDGLQHGDLQQRAIRAEHPRASDPMGDARCECLGAHEPKRLTRSGDSSDACTCRGEVGNTQGNGRHEGRTESSGQQGRSDVAEYGCAVGDTESIGDGSRRLPFGIEPSVTSTSGASGRGVELFAPGPLDSRWPGIVADRPDLAPATEPGVRMLADGLAYLVDESRNHQLRQAGNGVVAAQAGCALVILFRRAGLWSDE